MPESRPPPRHRPATTPPQHEARFQTWSSALDAVVHHNLRSGEPHTLGLNAFSDLTPAQFRAQMLASSSSEEEQLQPEAAAVDPRDPGIDAAGSGTRASDARQHGSRGDGAAAHRKLLQAGAGAVDWTRTPGALLPVESQGQCASGYAFAAMALLEASSFLSTGASVPLSKQQIVDCSRAYGNPGCTGGTPGGGGEERGMFHVFLQPRLPPCRRTHRTPNN